MKTHRKVVITDEAFEAIRTAHPFGATHEAIALACGVTESCVWQWEKAALEKVRRRLERAGFEWTEPTYRPSITDGGDGQSYDGEMNGILAARDAIKAKRAEAREARERELSAPSAFVAALAEELDRATWRARRAALVLGEVRALAVDAEAA